MVRLNTCAGRHYQSIGLLRIAGTYGVVAAHFIAAQSNGLTQKRSGD